MRSAVPLPFAPQLDALMDRLVARYANGRTALRAEEIGELAWGVGTLWEGFTGARALAGEGYLATPELLHAYALYYLPRSYVQARLALRHLEDGAPVRRVLDLGSGPGPLLLAARDAFGLDGAALTAVDHDPRALALAHELCGARTFTAKLPALPPSLASESFDLITLGLVVNELWAGQDDAVAQRAAWLREQVWPRVAEGGHLVVIEPALKETGRQALQLRDLLVQGGMRVRAPCTRQSACPALEKERDWCHAGLRFTPPKALASIGKAVGIDPSDVRFSYFVFEKGPGADARAERLRVVSERMEEKGRAKVWVCGEAGRLLLDRQDKHRTPDNAAFDALVRDDLIAVTDAEPRAEGLRVQAHTRVARLQGAAER